MNTDDNIADPVHLNLTDPETWFNPDGKIICCDILYQYLSSGAHHYCGWHDEMCRAFAQG